MAQFVDDNEPELRPILSIPLDANTHNLDGGAQYDLERSWAMSQAINWRKASDSEIVVSVDVYNFGSVDSYAEVKIILHHRNYGSSPNVPYLDAPVHFVKAPASKGEMPSKTRVRIPIKISFPYFSITHIYAVVYDPLFDRPSDAAIELLKGPVSFNPARLSRQIACLIIDGHQGGMSAAFELEKVETAKVDGLKWHWSLVNRSLSAPEFVLMGYTGSIEPVNFYVNRFIGNSDVEVLNIHLKTKTITDSKQYSLYMRDYSMSDNIDHKNGNWFAQLNDPLSDKHHAAVTINGKSSGIGDVVDVNYSAYSYIDRSKIGSVWVRYIAK